MVHHSGVAGVNSSNFLQNVDFEQCLCRTAILLTNEISHMQYLYLNTFVSFYIYSGTNCGTFEMFRNSSAGFRALHFVTDTTIFPKARQISSA